MLGTLSDGPAGDPWPVVDYGEPASHSRSQPTLDDKTTGEIYQPVHNHEQSNPDIAGTLRPEIAAAEPDASRIKPESLSTDVEGSFAGLNQIPAATFKSSTEQKATVEPPTLTSGERKALLGRRRDSEEAEQNLKRPRTQVKSDKLSLSPQPVSTEKDKAMASIKREPEVPILKRQGDTEEDERDSKRRRLEPKVEDAHA